MLEIFFSEGAAGSILDAEPASMSDISSTTDVFPAAKTSPDAGSMTTENHTAVEEIISNSHHINDSVEFDSEKILCFPLDLSIGDISAPFSDSRADFLQSQMLLYGSDFADVGRELVETARRSLSRVQSCTEPLRIWYSRNPDELCGFCHLLSLLPKDADIRVVELPDHEVLETELRRYSGWADVEPSEFSRLLALQRPLSAVERRYFIALWRELQSDNGDLRALVNGRLCTVNADFLRFFPPAGAGMSAPAVSRGPADRRCPEPTPSWHLRPSDRIAHRGTDFPGNSYSRHSTCRKPPPLSPFSAKMHP